MGLMWPLSKVRHSLGRWHMFAYISFKWSWKLRNTSTHQKPDNIKNNGFLRSDECDSHHLKLFVAECPFRALLLNSTLPQSLWLWDRFLFHSVISSSTSLSLSFDPALFQHNIKLNIFCSPSMSPMSMERS